MEKMYSTSDQVYTDIQIAHRDFEDNPDRWPSFLEYQFLKDPHLKILNKSEEENFLAASFINLR